MSAALTFVVCCPGCGEHLDIIAVESSEQPWNEPVLWGYLAQAGHNRQCRGTRPRGRPVHSGATDSASRQGIKP
jgi:hypothetical protein